MTNLNSVTIIFILAIVAVVTIFDAAQYARKGQDATISHILYVTAQRWPIIAFVLGVLMGHLFWVNS